jgi:hypothetical protein
MTTLMPAGASSPSNHDSSTGPPSQASPSTVVFVGDPGVVDDAAGDHESPG